MKMLFVYRFLTLGGVETVLKTRADLLPGMDIEPRFWFLENVDGLPLFKDMLDRVSIGGLFELQEHLSSSDYGAFSVIDTPEALGLEATQSPQPRCFLECHTPYRENLAYLSDVKGNQVSIIIVPSRWQAAEVKRRLRDDIEVKVIPNPMGVRFAAPIKPFVPVPDRPVVAWLGRMDDLKNWTAFIELAGKLAGRDLVFDLWIAARSPSDAAPEHLLRLAEKHDVIDRLKWFRNLSHTAVPRFLDAVRDSGGLVVSTALGESFGMILAEAMARGCAVVAPQHGPFPEFIEPDSSGILVPPGDWRKAAEACERLLGDGALRRDLGMNARRSILAHHQPEAAVARLADVIRQHADANETTL